MPRMSMKKARELYGVKLHSRSSEDMKKVRAAAKRQEQMLQKTGQRLHNDTISRMTGK